MDITVHKSLPAMQLRSQHKTSSPKISPAITKYLNRVLCGDSLKVLRTLPDESVDCIITSPPYYNLRDYGRAGQIGLESGFDEYLEKLFAVFDEARRVLKNSGTCWVVIGDSFGGSGTAVKQVADYAKARRKHRHAPKTTHARGRYAKCLLQIPSRFAVGMIEKGWILRSEIIWHKPNVLPSSAIDRFTVDFEKIFFFAKNSLYYFKQQFEPLADAERLKRRFFNPESVQKYKYASFSAINQDKIEESRQRILKRGMRNKRCVWTIGTSRFLGEHYATFPERLIETPILAGCPKDGIVLDPFMGSGTTAIVAKKLGRNFIGIDLNPKYMSIAKNRLKN